MRAGTVLVLVGLCVLPACATTLAPAPAPLVIRDTLADDARICVQRDPLNVLERSLVCITVGDLRRSIRRRVDVSTERAVSR